MLVLASHCFIPLLILPLTYWLVPKAKLSDDLTHIMGGSNSSSSPGTGHIRLDGSVTNFDSDGGEGNHLSDSGAQDVQLAEMGNVAGAAAAVERANSEETLLSRRLDSDEVERAAARDDDLRDDDDDDNDGRQQLLAASAREEEDDSRGGSDRDNNSGDVAGDRGDGYDLSPIQLQDNPD